MDLEVLAQIGEFVGGIVVVVSLFYVALQVRQNTQSLRTENYGRVLDRISAVQARLSTDPDFTDIFSRGVADLGNLSASERIRLAWALREMFGNYEFMFHQAQQGALPDEVWERWSTTMEWWLTFPGIRAWWDMKPTPFSASFSECVEGFLARTPTRKDGAGPWQSLLDAAPEVPRGLEGLEMEGRRAR